MLRTPPLANNKTLIPPSNTEILPGPDKNPPGAEFSAKSVKENITGGTKRASVPSCYSGQQLG
jgi:hypothetical protein